MKLQICRKAFVIVWICFCAFIVSAQNNHSRYSGDYEITGLPVFDRWWIPHGKCNYEYYENSDGSRIFDGNFSWRHFNARDSETYTIKGQFKDDIQVGKWEWNNSSGKIVILTFNEQGILHGPFKIDNGKRGRRYEGTFENGRLKTLNYELAEGFEKEEIRHAQFNSSENPVGTWTFGNMVKIKANDYQMEYYKANFNQNGEIMKPCGKRNPETGDFRDLSWETQGMADRIVSKVKSEIKEYRMRSTKL